MIIYNLVLAFIEDLFFFLSLFKIYLILPFMMGYVVGLRDTVDKSFCLSGTYVPVEMK